MVKILLVITVISLVIIGLAGCSSAPEPSPPQQQGTADTPTPSTSASKVSPAPETAPELEVGPQVGKLAPDFKFMNPGGKNISLSDLRGSSVMLNFWATWCGPCKIEMPLIQELAYDEEKADKGLVLLTVNGGESADKVARFMNEHGFSFPVLLDTQMGVARAYNVRAIPTTFFIDRDGIIKDIKVGAFSSTAEIERKLGKIIE